MLEMYRTRFIWMSPAKPSYVMPMSVNINAAAFVHFFCLNIWRKKTFIEFWIWQQWQLNVFYSTFCVSALFQSTSRSEIPSATFNELRIYGFLLIHFFSKASFVVGKKCNWILYKCNKFQASKHIYFHHINGYTCSRYSIGIQLSFEFNHVYDTFFFVCQSHNSFIYRNYLLHSQQEHTHVTFHLWNCPIAVSMLPVVMTKLTAGYRKLYPNYTFRCSELFFNSYVFCITIAQVKLRTSWKRVWYKIWLLPECCNVNYVERERYGDNLRFPWRENKPVLCLAANRIKW